MIDLGIPISEIAAGQPMRDGLTRHIAMRKAEPSLRETDYKQEKRFACVQFEGNSAIRALVIARTLDPNSKDQRH